MIKPGETPDVGNGGVEEEDPTAPVVRDRRRLDPETGQLREPVAETSDATDAAGDGSDASSANYAKGSRGANGASDGTSSSDATSASDAEKLAAQRLEDLQRLQAEFVNYRRRVERDRAASRTGAIAELCEALIPVMDAIELAREHGELEGGPFQGMAENLEATLAKFGWERYGAAGEEFDPQVHEALMHEDDPEASTATIKQVLQPGYRVEERVLRAARVAVVGP